MGDVPRLRGDERGELAAVELARDTIDPAFVLTREVGWGGRLRQRRALPCGGRRVRLAGLSAEELATAPEGAREAADRTFAAALGVGFEPLSGPRRPPSCLRSPGNGGEPRVLTLPAGGVVLDVGGDGAEARLRRYASESFPVELGSVPAGAARLAIPADRSTEPWELELVADGPVSVCRL